MAPTQIPGITGFIAWTGHPLVQIDDYPSYHGRVIIQWLLEANSETHSQILGLAQGILLRRGRRKERSQEIQRHHRKAHRNGYPDSRENTDSEPTIREHAWDHIGPPHMCDSFVVFFYVWKSWQREQGLSLCFGWLLGIYPSCLIGLLTLNTG